MRVADVAALVQVRCIMIHLQIQALSLQLAFRRRFAQVDKRLRSCMLSFAKSMCVAALCTTVATLLRSPTCRRGISTGPLRRFFLL